MTTYNTIQREFTKNYLGSAALAIIASTCVGSIAVMMILMHGNGFLQMAMVFLAVAVCNAHNAAILTVQKPKLVFDLLVLSLVVNILLIVGNSLY